MPNDPKSSSNNAGRSRLPLGSLSRKALLGLAVISGTVSCGCRTFCPKSLEQNVVQSREASLQGLDAMQQGRWDEAERIFAAAVKCCPVDERARGCYAETLWRRGSCDEALAHMQEAVKLSGGDAQRRVQLGEMHLALGQLPQAAEQANAAIEKNNRLSTAWALRGDIYLARGQYAEALADYHRSLAYCEHQPRVQLAIARIYSGQKRPQRALSTLETLAEQFPPSEIPVEVLAMQGTTLKELGRHHDAVEMLAQAAAKGSPSADLLYHLADAQFHAGDASAAEQSLTQALAQNPSHPDGLQLRSQLLEKEQALTARVDTTRVYR